MPAPNPPGAGITGDRALPWHLLGSPLLPPPLRMRMPSGWATSHGSRALCLETVVCLGGVFLPPWRPRQLFFISAPFPWPRQQAVGVASWVKATPACSEPGCGHGRALPDTVLLPHRGHREPAGVWGGGTQGQGAGRSEGGGEWTEMSLPRNLAWVEERRKGGRGRARHTGHEGQSPHTPPHAPSLPTGPLSQPLSRPPPRQSPQGFGPPFPFPSFQGNPDVWAQLRHCSASLPCQMFPLPPPSPGRGVCSPAGDTGEGDGAPPVPTPPQGLLPCPL